MEKRVLSLQSTAYPLSQLWQLTLFMSSLLLEHCRLADCIQLYNTTLPCNLRSRLLVPSTTKQKCRAQISSYCTSTRTNPACHCRSYRHTSPPYEWQQAREIKTSSYCSQAGHLHSTVCSDRDRRGPCTLHCSGASPEGSSAPEARSHLSPAPRCQQSCPVGGPSRWPHCKMHGGT